eukprot:COSAG02_NODE_23443_length_718_cov_2.617124_1_plen_91_part_01
MYRLYPLTVQLYSAVHGARAVVPARADCLAKTSAKTNAETAKTAKTSAAAKTAKTIQTAICKGGPSRVALHVHRIDTDDLARRRAALVSRP